MSDSSGPELRVLGNPQVLQRNQSIRLPAKSMGLLAYLAVEGTADRRRVAPLFWREGDVQRALHSLSQAMYVIRRYLGSNAVQASPNTVSLAAVQTDISQFHEAVRGNDWVSAAGSYKGAFLEGFSLPGCLEFEQWADVTRSELAGIAEDVLTELVSSGHWSTALQLSQVLLARDPDNPATCRAYVHVLFHLQDLPTLREFLDDRPRQIADQLWDQYERLVNRGKNSVGEGRPFFVGRDEAMTRLSKRLELIAQGSASVTVIEGEAGIGKTKLAERFARLATLRGARVLDAVAYHAEQNVPFGVVGQLLERLTNRELRGLASYPWMEVINRAFAVADQEDRSAEIPAHDGVGLYRILECLKRLVVLLAQDRPLMLVVDDLHNCDSASVAFLHYVIRRSGDCPLLVLGTMRLDKDFVDDPIREWQNCDVLTLQGLSERHIRDWLRHLGATVASEVDPQVRELSERTGGNPLLLSLLLNPKTGSAWTSSSPPGSVLDYYRPLLASRSPEAKAFLKALAIAGEPADSGVVSQIAGLDADGAKGAIGELVGAALITSSDGKVALRHGLLGEVATSDLSNFEMKRLHGRAARVLSRGGQPSDALVAISLDIAGHRREAFRAAIRACEACDILHAQSEKEFFLKLALSNAETKDDQAKARTQLAETYLKQQRLKEGLTVLDAGESAGLSLSSRRSLEATRLRILTETTGDVEKLKALWREARLIAPDLDPLVAADTYARMASVAHDLGADALTLEISELILDEVATLPMTVAVAQRLLRPTAMIGFIRGYGVALRQLGSLPDPAAGDPVYASEYHRTKGSLHVAAGELTTAEEHFTESLAIAERFALFDRYYAIINNIGVCLTEQGRFNEAEEFCNSALEYTSEDVGPSHHSIARDNLTILLWETGRYERAVKLGEQALARGASLSRRELMSLHGIVGLCGLEMGDLTLCRQAERELELLFQSHELSSNDMSYVQIFAARMRALRGDTSSAMNLLARAAQGYRGLNKPARWRVEVEQARLSIAAGQDCTDTIDRILGELRGTGAAPLIDRAEGLQTRLRLRSD